MKYRLVFNGELTGEVPRDECLAQLAELFGKKISAIESEMFRGKPIVIKKTSDEGIASRFISAFDQAGAVLHAETRGMHFGTEQPPEISIRPDAEAKIADRDTEVTRLRPAMRRVDNPVSPASSKLSDEDKTHQRTSIPDQDDRDK